MKMISEKLRLRKFAGLLVATLVVTSIYSCSDDDDVSNADNARIAVDLTAAPANFESVMVEVVDVWMHADASAGLDDDGWESIANSEPGVIDLLSLTGGETMTIADLGIPAGTVGQLWLELGTNHSLVIDGQSQNLSAPGTQQSGLRVQLNQEVEAGEELNLLLDFDVDKSVEPAGSAGGYSLVPVIKITDVSQTARILGEVQPSATRSLVKAKNASNTISAYTDTDGKFALNGLPEGTYQILVTPLDSPEEVAQNNVLVTAGQLLEMDTIFLE